MKRVLVLLIVTLCSFGSFAFAAETRGNDQGITGGGAHSEDGIEP